MGINFGKCTDLILSNRYTKYFILALIYNNKKKVNKLTLKLCKFILLLFSIEYTQEIKLEMLLKKFKTLKVLLYNLIALYFRHLHI